MRTVAIVQARMGSTRLPGKVLRDLAGQPMLAQVVDRLRRAKRIDDVVIATTVQPADAVIAQLCAERGWTCYRGDEQDVLDRYYQAAREARADVVVRITADCPLIDPGVVDSVVDVFAQNQPKVDYAASRGFPRGLDTEVFGFPNLERAWKEANTPSAREHVTPYFYTHPELFEVLEVKHSSDLSQLRWTVDTPEDFRLVELIVRHFGHARFTWEEALALIEARPEWKEINSHIQQKSI